MSRKSRHLVHVAFALLPFLILAMVLGGIYGLKRTTGQWPPLTALDVRDPLVLEALFESRGFSWPPDGPVPALALQRIPDGFDALAVEQKKSLFFRALLPLIVAENEVIRRERARLLDAFAEKRLQRGTGYGDWALELARRYRVEGDLREPAVRGRLLRRVDVVPAALVLAQAANESGWGGSRFAREANNLFGQWTYRAEEGVAPLDRADSARHYVRAYPALIDSVRSHLHNINIGHAYRDLRRRREAMRATGKRLDALELAAGLVRYSERGTAYVEEIRALIEGNGLNHLGPFRLAE